MNVFLLSCLHNVKNDTVSYVDVASAFKFTIFLQKMSMKWNLLQNNKEVLPNNISFLLCIVHLVLFHSKDQACAVEVYKWIFLKRRLSQNSPAMASFCGQQVNLGHGLLQGAFMGKRVPQMLKGGGGDDDCFCGCFHSCT